MILPVRFSRRALRQLDALEAHIAAEGGEERAIAHVARLRDDCLSLGLVPQRGARRDDIRRGVRIVGWHRRAAAMTC